MKISSSRSTLAPVGLLALLVHTAAVAEAEGPVGTATLDLEHKPTGRKVISELWFEAAPDAKIEWFSPRPALRPVPIARNADPAPPLRKYPLIVASHGNWGSRFSQGWLALELVQAGYVVLSTSHPGTMADDQTAAGRYRLWERSRDVSFAIDEVLKSPKWATLIDENRIGFVGHSFGGWTGVSLAGARYDPIRQRNYCRNAERKDFYCENTLKDDIAAVPATDAGDSFRDSRIKAFYIMGSGPGQGFSPDSLKSITVPFVVDTAQFDEPLSNSTNLAAQIADAREVQRPVGHFAYVPECRWLIGSMIMRLAGLPLCEDPKGVDRGRVHKEVANEIVAFFQKNLTRAD
jgi:predicted dienelactone hydrolase